MGPVAATLLSAVLALDGESTGGSANTGLAVISVVSIVG